MKAWAAETAGGHAGSFYEAPEFWVMVAFVILILAAGKKVYRIVGGMLDDRADAISNQIEEATRLREEAQELLASFERKQAEAVDQANDIMERARNEADRMAKLAVENLEASLKRREQQAMDRIAQAEQQAADDVRRLAVETAMDATNRLLADNMTDAKADELIKAATDELPEKLN